MFLDLKACRTLYKYSVIRNDVTIRIGPEMIKIARNSKFHSVEGIDIFMT